ncbi:acyltransferase family protein [Novosphingobium aquiterrae]|uniref:Acyltransferase family protein n=1 Tax=Novosphingobium aquiterrae TaxID=624388 RepID=A0ABV6PF98_9SPHN
MAANSKLWARAAGLAQQTLPSRNRYVDFLRALSILAVVVGHWLVAAPYIKDGAVVGGHLLGILPWSQWLTWLFQVMPLFFLVGGYSNGVSWAANRRDGGTYIGWYAGRLRRLVWPLMPLFVIWTLFALFGTALGVERAIVKLAAQLALVPVWFLAVYLGVAAVVPWSWAAWRRWGLGSIAALILGAIAVDVARLHFGVPLIGFANFGFVWLAVHQLGYAWPEGRIGRRGALAVALGGFACLLALVHFGPYPVAMIGVPGSDLSNSMPPTLALLALGLTQTGVALLLEPAARRWLQRPLVWTAVVLVNGMIMTIYLWHLTAFVLVMVAAWLAGGLGLHVTPGSGAWWLARPLWFAVYVLALLPMIARFSRYENMGRGSNDRELPLWRLVVALVMICIGLAGTAAISIASPDGVTGVRLWLVAMPVVGAALIGFGPVHSLARRIG